MSTRKALTAIDYAKLFFAISIITLHVPYKNTILNLYSQIIGRLGVPFFFAISGYFLYSGIAKSGFTYTKKYCLRIAKLLGIWFLIYLPLFLYTYMRNEGLRKLVQEIVFLTPGYLWYLSTLCVAAFLFGLFYMRKPKLFLIAASILYVVGLSANTYIHILNLEHVWAPYLSLFLTTRNSVFFALLFLGIGALLKKGNTKLTVSKSAVFSFLTFILFTCEVLWVLNTDSQNKDYSFYILIPFVIFFLVNLFLNLSLKVRDTMVIRQFSTFLYCSQYGFMVVLDILSSRFSFLKNGFLIWLLIVTLSVCAFWILNSSKVGRRVLGFLS